MEVVYQISSECPNTTCIALLYCCRCSRFILQGIWLFCHPAMRLRLRNQARYKNPSPVLGTHPKFFPDWQLCCEVRHHCKSCKTVGDAIGNVQVSILDMNATCKLNGGGLSRAIWQPAARRTQCQCLPRSKGPHRHHAY